MAQTFNCSPKGDTEDAPNEDMNSNENVSWSAINVDWREWEEYCLIQVLAEADGEFFKCWVYLQPKFKH